MTCYDMGQVFHTHIPGVFDATGSFNEEANEFGTGGCDINLLCADDVFTIKHKSADWRIFQNALCVAFLVAPNRCLDPQRTSEWGARNGLHLLLALF